MSCARIPDEIADALRLYVDHGISPGSFTRACLENNLLEALEHASLMSMGSMQDIMTVILNHVPGGAWGSPEAVETWRSHRGKEGMAAKTAVP